MVNWDFAADLLGPPLPMASAATGSLPVLRARGLTKIYRMGDVEVLALDGVDFSADA